ncbi:MAG: metallophosphoesterase [Candidatus Latescibacterota bacterium]
MTRTCPPHPRLAGRPRGWVLGAAVLLGGCVASPLPDPQSRMQAVPNQLEYLEDPAAGPVRFLVVGDTQVPRSGQERAARLRRALYDSLAAALADSALVVHLGDVVDNGSRAEQWARFDAEIGWERLTQEQRRRFVPIPGNHDYKTHWWDWGGGDLSLYFRRFAHLQHRRYYFFTRGASAFVCMDAGRNGIRKVFGEGWENGREEQEEWLQRAVLPYLEGRSHSLRRIFLFVHKPGWVTPVERRNDDTVRMLRRFDDFNRDHGYPFEIYSFSGHIHTFSHIRRDHNGDGQGEVEQFTSGGGGGEQVGREYFGRVGRPADLDAYRLGQYRQQARGEGLDGQVFDAVRRDNTHFGYLEVEAAERVRVRYHRFQPQDGGFRVDYEYVR